MRKNIVFIALSINFMLLFNSCENDDSILKTVTFEVICSTISDNTSNSIIYSSWSDPFYFLESYDNDYCQDYVQDTNILGQRLNGFLDIIKKDPECYSSLHVSEGEYICKNNEEITDSIFRFEFYEEKCMVKIHATKCLLYKGQKMSRKQYICLFNEGSYSIDPPLSLKVTENEAVILYLGMPSSYLTLANNQGVIEGKCNYTKFLEKADDINMVLEYSIDGDYAMLIGEDGKLWRKVMLNE